MDVLVLIDKLDDTIHNAKPVPLTDQVRVDKEEVYDILDQMRATIPEEIKQARWIVKERQEMLAEAKREAERIIREAREEQIRLIGEEEIVKQAERQADEIIEDARAREREIRLGAEDYADDILNTLEVNLTKFIAAVQRGRDRLQGREEAEVGSALRLARASAPRPGAGPQGPAAAPRRSLAARPPARVGRFVRYERPPAAAAGSVRVWVLGGVFAGLLRSRSTGRCVTCFCVTALSAAGGPVTCGRLRRRGSTDLEFTRGPRAAVDRQPRQRARRAAGVLRRVRLVAVLARARAGRGSASRPAASTRRPGIETMGQIWVASAGRLLRARRAHPEPSSARPSRFAAWRATSTPATASATSTAPSPSTRSSASRSGAGWTSATRPSTSSWGCPARTPCSS